MAAERYLSWRIPDSRVGNNIGKIDKKPVTSIYTSLFSLEIFDMQVEKAAVFFDSVFNLDVFAVFFCNLMEFWLIFGSFQRGTQFINNL